LPEREDEAETGVEDMGRENKRASGVLAVLGQRNSMQQQTLSL
jgi:hypothetical protein